MDSRDLLIIMGVIAFAIITLLIYILIKNRKKSCDAFENMEGHEFEYFCAELLERHGFIDVEVTKASGDYGVDVLAEKDGVTYAVQCKRYNNPVGVKAIQEAYAGRDYYDRMVGAVMTNQYFTTPAVEAAKKLKILLWDGGYIEEMMADEEIVK